VLLQEWKRKLDPEEEMERPVGPGVRELVVSVVERPAEPGVELVVTWQECAHQRGTGEMKGGMMVLVVQVVRGDKKVVED